jgi:preprotein translocase subunit SecD
VLIAKKKEGSLDAPEACAYFTSTKVRILTQKAPVQVLIAKKKEGALDAPEAYALEAFEKEGSVIFSKTTASGQHLDAFLVEAFHRTLLEYMLSSSTSSNENTDPQTGTQTGRKTWTSARGLSVDKPSMQLPLRVSIDEVSC